MMIENADFHAEIGFDGGHSVLQMRMETGAEERNR